MANLSKFEVLKAFSELRSSDRAFVLSQITFGKGGASRANIHEEVADTLFAQGRFCPIARAAHSSLWP